MWHTINHLGTLTISFIVWETHGKTSWKKKKLLTNKLEEEEKVFEQARRRRKCKQCFKWAQIDSFLMRAFLSILIFLERSKFDKFVSNLANFDQIWKFVTLALLFMKITHIYQKITTINSSILVFILIILKPCENCP